MFKHNIVNILKLHCLFKLKHASVLLEKVLSEIVP